MIEEVHGVPTALSLSLYRRQWLKTIGLVCVLLMLTLLPGRGNAIKINLSDVYVSIPAPKRLSSKGDE